MHLRTTSEGTLIEHEGTWIGLGRALASAGNDDPQLAAASVDALAFLRADDGVRAQAAALVSAVADKPELAVDPSTAGLPFTPRSMRAFTLWESHWTASSRMLVKNFFPPVMWAAVRTFERTGRTFPALKPNRHFWTRPSFYVGNHSMVLADGQDMWWPSHTEALDFELELACVLRAPIADATPEEASAAIGGWFILNDWSARDVQAEDARHNAFGPVVKAKTFANSIGSEIVTADEFGDWKLATGRVRVDGEVWCEGSTANPAHDIGEMLAYASRGECLDAGDVISMGTMPGCCGLELDRWIQPGQTVELEIDRIGRLRNRVVAGAAPRTAVPA
ncbi:MAG: fumarylacetoacetate hydrolase family protein [Solirubrobacteraceae bacterium]|nr:fumarylacetoacetate hydrolase family protein [Solirubrobacteraceae bacterium]